MARISQRFSKGGRFKKEEAGDLGLRAGKTQADIVNDSLKLQRARVEEQGSQTIQNLKGIARIEAWNQETLSQLEDRIYQNKRDAIKIRRDTEVASLEGEAAEAGRKAQFWKEFSPTLAKTFAKTAKVTSAAIQKKAAEAKFDKDFPLGVVTAKAIEDLDSKLIKLSLQQSDEFKDEPEKLGILSRIFSGNNRFYRAKVAQEIHENMPQFELSIKEIADKSGGKESMKWTPGNIPRLYQEYAAAILSRYDISPNTKMGKKIEAVFIKYGNKKATYTKNIIDVQKGRTHLNTTLQNFKAIVIQEGLQRVDEDGKLNEKYISSLQSIQNAARSSLRQSGNSFKMGYDTPMEENYAVAQALAPFFANEDDYLEHVFNLPEKGKWSETILMRNKKPERKAFLESEFAKIHDNTWYQKNEQTKKDEKANAAKKLAEAKQLVIDNDVNTTQGRKNLVIALKSFEGYEKATNTISSALVFDYNSKSEIAISNMIDQEIKNGNLSYLRETINLLPQSKQEEYTAHVDALELYNKHMTDKDETSTAKATISAHLGKNGIDIDTQEMSQAVQIFKDVGRNIFVDYALDNPGDKFKLTDALNQVNTTRTGAVTSGTGLWRVIKDRSGTNTLAAFANEEFEFKDNKEIPNEWGNGLNDEDFKIKIKDGISNLMRIGTNGEIQIIDENIGGNRNDKDSYNLLPIDTVDTWFKNNARGETMAVPKRVEEMYKRQYTDALGTPPMSRSQIMQAIAMAQGKSSFGGNPPSIDILPDQLDKATFDLTKSSIDYGDLKFYNSSDLMRLGVLQSTLGDNEPPPISKSLEDIYTKSKLTGTDPMELAIKGDPIVTDYNYFTPVPFPDLNRITGDPGDRTPPKKIREKTPWRRLSNEEYNKLSEEEKDNYRDRMMKRETEIKKRIYKHDGTLAPYFQMIYDLSREGFIRKGVRSYMPEIEGYETNWKQGDL